MTARFCVFILIVAVLAKANGQGFYFPTKSVNPCVPNPCRNGGSCVKFGFGNSYYCDCQSGFYGEHCERKISLGLDLQCPLDERNDLGFRGKLEFPSSEWSLGTNYDLKLSNRMRMRLELDLDSELDVTGSLNLKQFLESSTLDIDLKLNNERNYFNMKLGSNDPNNKWTLEAGYLNRWVKDFKLDLSTNVPQMGRGGPRERTGGFFRLEGQIGSQKGKERLTFGGLLTTPNLGIPSRLELEYRRELFGGGLIGGLSGNTRGMWSGTLKYELERDNGFFNFGFRIGPERPHERPTWGLFLEGRFEF